MKPGDPVRWFGLDRVCRANWVGLHGYTRTCARTNQGRIPRGRFTDDLLGLAATHRQDGTAFRVCKVCWPDGEVTRG